MHKIYIELVFIDNFTINLLIILLSSLLTKTKKRLGRFALSAAAGGAYACAVFGAEGFAVSVYAKITVSLIMCFIAYYEKNAKAFLKNACAFYITSFVFSGAIYAVMYCFGEPQAFGAVLVINPLIRYIIIGFGVGAALLIAFGRIKRRVLHRENNSAEVVLLFKGKREAVKAFIDTGNMLSEPLGGSGVVFVTEAVARRLFDKETFDMLSGRIAKSSEKLRFIPCATAAGIDMFYGIEVDGIYLKKNVVGTKAVVCIARASLAEGCGAVVSAELIDELGKGAGYGSGSCPEDNSVGIVAAAHRGGSGLHKRKRGAPAAADAEGGSVPDSDAGQGGQIGTTGAD